MIAIVAGAALFALATAALAGCVGAAAMYVRTASNYAPRTRRAGSTPWRSRPARVVAADLPGVLVPHFNCGKD